MGAAIACALRSNASITARLPGSGIGWVNRPSTTKTPIETIGSTSSPGIPSPISSARNRPSASAWNWSCHSAMAADSFARAAAAYDVHGDAEGAAAARHNLDVVS